MANKRLLVVGGGSAGWITASYLNAVLNRDSRKRVDIALIESANVGRVGVGEATVPTIRHILQTIGIDESLFMRKTDATFKQAIRFDNWLSSEGHSYYHPFDRRQAGTVDFASQDWLASDRSIPYAETVSVQPQFCEAGLSPRMPNSPDFSSPMPYAYHMDAEKFADYLCEHSVQPGVRHYLDDVATVEQHEDGRIAAVTTQSGERHEADLFIDCTGFLGLLIGKTLGVGLVDFSQWLLCDRAIAMRVPYDQYYPGGIKPYTTATALSSGWKWDIGLSNRRGTGYVYSSQFIDDETAEQELRHHEGAHAEHLDARRLQFYVGRREQFWVKNCIAIGLSGGFIEPLESTGIYLVEFAAITLAEHFPFADEDMAALAKRFNTIIGNRYDEVLDFVNMHYCLSQREDTEFWRQVRQQEHITERLQEKFDFWQIKPPSISDFDDQFRLFSHQSYEYILYGMNFYGDKYADRFGDRAKPSRVPPNIANVVNAGKTRLPKHQDWIATELQVALK